MPTMTQLARRAAHVATIHDYRRLQLQLDGLKWCPSNAAGMLDEDALGVLQYFGGDRAVAEAKAAVSKALGHVDPAPVAAAARAAVEFPTELWNVDASDQAAELDRWSTKFALRAVPVGIWATFVAAGRLKREALEAKVDALEKRLAAVEARPETKDAGVWRANEIYHPGAIVSHSGSAWICRTLHSSAGVEPSHEHFRLLVKKGRDAR